MKRFHSPLNRSASVWEDAAMAKRFAKQTGGKEAVQENELGSGFVSSVDGGGKRFAGLNPAGLNSAAKPKRFALKIRRNRSASGSNSLEGGASLNRGVKRFFAGPGGKRPVENATLKRFPPTLPEPKRFASKRPHWLK